MALRPLLGIAAFVICYFGFCRRQPDFLLHERTPSKIGPSHQAFESFDGLFDDYRGLVAGLLAVDEVFAGLGDTEFLHTYFGVIKGLHGFGPER